MDISQNQVIQVKEVCSKKINKTSVIFYVLIFFFKTVVVFGNPPNSEIQKALNLIYNTKEFQSSFLQEEIFEYVVYNHIKYINNPIKPYLKT